MRNGLSQPVFPVIQPPGYLDAYAVVLLTPYQIVADDNKSSTVKRARISFPGPVFHSGLLTTGIIPCLIIN